MRKTVSTVTACALVAALSVFVGASSARADHRCGTSAYAGEYGTGYSGGYLVQTQSYRPAPVYYQQPSYTYTYSTPPSYHHTHYQPQRYVEMSNQHSWRSHDEHRNHREHRRHHDRD